MTSEQTRPPAAAILHAIGFPRALWLALRMRVNHLPRDYEYRIWDWEMRRRGEREPTGAAGPARPATRRGTPLPADKVVHCPLDPPPVVLYSAIVPPVHETEAMRAMEMPAGFYYPNQIRNDGGSGQRVFGGVVLNVNGDPIYLPWNIQAGYSAFSAFDELKRLWEYANWDDNPRFLETWGKVLSYNKVTSDYTRTPRP